MSRRRRLVRDARADSYRVAETEAIAALADAVVARLAPLARSRLLVTGYGAAVRRVPPGPEPRRVSVDAIEYWIIYWEHWGAWPRPR